MQLVYLHGYPDKIGRRFAWVAVGTPPASAPAAGDPVTLPSFNNYIDCCDIGTAISQAFTGAAAPSVAGARAAWLVRYKFATAGSSLVSINAAGSGQTPGNYAITFSGGTLGTGGVAASGFVTVGAGGTLTSLTVYPGRGYTTVPTTATITGSGGTPGTLTAAASVAGAYVPAGTNLSSEQFQPWGFGGTY